ncbi:hypothetical protein [Streptomyces anulatus]|uniref:hypothetical protein n=1 Tax=Streptomyces anulatus TaxID=1892 RepID=UPI002E0D4941|nr:hypothetical protein OG557_38715 [Streptomyces anulatus]
MDFHGTYLAIILVLGVVQFGSQLLCQMKLLAKKTAFKSMFMCWSICAMVCAAMLLWAGIAIAAPFAAVTGFLWWRHRDDDDDDAGRRRRRLKSSAKSKLPRPVAVARPVPTEA